MLRRKIEKKLINWQENRSQALLIVGARQIGKTYSITNFINNNFKYAIEINFAYRTDLIDMFCMLNNSEQLMLRLSAIEGAKMHPHETVIFFDEIQLLYQRREELKKAGKLPNGTQDIITSIKKVVSSGEYRFILSGSLLGVTVRDVVLNPVGYLDVIQMYPLDFEEFLWNINVGENIISYLKNCFEEKKEVDSGVHQMIKEYFDEYVLVGGMPEAVLSYIKNKNLYLVQQTQEQIVNAYSLDIATYIQDDQMKLRLREIYKAIPSELNSKNKRFVSSHVIDKGYLKNNNIQDEFLWLTNAGIAIPVYNVTEATIPLVLASERRTLKLFMSDIGLLDSMLFDAGIREKLLKKEKEINYGAPYENIVAQELYAHGFADKIFYYNSKKNGEVDFIIEYNNDVLPIEIKSGKPTEMNVYNHYALNNLVKKYNPSMAYVFGDCNFIKENESIYQFPIYMIMFISK